MNSINDFLTGIDSQTVLVVAAVVISLLFLKLLWRILNRSAGLILMIVAIVLGLQYLFGISPSQLWGEMAHLPQEILRLVNNIQLPELGLLNLF